VSDPAIESSLTISSVSLKHGKESSVSGGKMIKKWTAKISTWNGSAPKPRKNQIVRSREIRAKLLDDLARKLSRTKYKAVELTSAGGHHDAGGYWTKKLVERVEFHRTLTATKKLLKKHTANNVILACAAAIAEQQPELAKALQNFFLQDNRDNEKRNSVRNRL
jgi:hypothetical protein